MFSCMYKSSGLLCSIPLWQQRNLSIQAKIQFQAKLLSENKYAFCILKTGRWQSVIHYLFVQASVSQRILSNDKLRVKRKRISESYKAIKCPWKCLTLIIFSYKMTNYICKLKILWKKCIIRGGRGSKHTNVTHYTDRETPI